MKMLFLGLFLAIPCMAGQFHFSTYDSDRETFTSLFNDPSYVQDDGQSLLISSTSNLNDVCKKLDAKLIYADLNHTQYTTVSAKQALVQSKIHEYKFEAFSTTQNNTYVSELACLPF